MAQINLLKQNTQSETVLRGLPSAIVKLLALVSLALIVYYGWVYVRVKQINKKIVNLQAEIEKTKNSALAMKGRDEVLTRQAQLKELSALIDNHFYISQLAPQLAKATLKTAYYTSLKTTTEGEVSLQVTVPSIAELDKFLQVFDLPQYNNYFNNVRIGAFHKVQTGSNVGYTFDLRMHYNPGIIKYQSNQAK